MSCLVGLDARIRMHGLAGQGAHRSETLCHREDSQRGMASPGAEDECAN